MATFALLYLNFSASPAVATDTGSDLQALSTNILLEERFRDLDTDGDGLQDWEEELWGTSKTNPDTDGDGIGDNEEVLAGRNPTIAGSGLSTDGSATTSNSLIARYQESNATEKLALDFFESYLRLKQTKQFDTTNKERLMRHLLSSSQQQLVPTRYREEQVITTQSSATAPMDYRQNLETIVRKYLLDVPDDLQLLYLEMTQQQAQQTTSIQQNVERYDNAIAELLATPVPEDAVSAHIQFVNALQLYRDTAHGLGQRQDDPLLTMVALQQYSYSQEQLQNGVVALRTYLEQHGLPFVVI